MRRSTLRHLLVAPAGLLLVAASSVACQGSAPHQAEARVRDPSRTTYFAQYGVSSHAYRPNRLNPSVDGSLYVGRMHWTTWDARSAVGRGVAHVNDCTPDCADGHYSTYRVTVHLGHPRELCGSRYFTSIRVRGPGYRTHAHWSGMGCR